MNKEQMTIKALFDTSKTQAGRRLSKYTYPWEVLPHIGEIAEAIGKRLPQDEYNHLGKNIWIHKSVNVPPTVALRGPAVIGPKTEIRNGAFIRGNVIAGEGVVIGNSAELKNVILKMISFLTRYRYHITITSGIPFSVTRLIWELVR